MEDTKEAMVEIQIKDNHEPDQNGSNGMRSALVRKYLEGKMNRI